MIHDVAIVGGGPVGLATAIEARLAGLGVVLIEQRTGPIDKACGEGLMPGAVPALERLGVHPRGHPLRGVSYRQGDRVVTHRFGAAEGLGVRRTTLHEALANRADELGVERVSAKVDSVDVATDSVTVNGELEAKWLIGCDGLHSTVARLVGLSRPLSKRARRYGVRQHFAVTPWSDTVEVYFAPGAELYVTPVAGFSVGVAMLARRGVDFDEAIQEVPELAARLAGAEPASTRKGAGPFRQRTKRRTAGRVLLVGDASGYVDAITGEGLRLGFAQAEAAVRCIIADRPQDYEQEWRRVTRDFRILTSGLVAWANSPLRGAIVPAAARLPRLFGTVVERLAR